MKQFIRQKPILFWCSALAGVLLLAYAVLGYWYVPRVVKDGAQQWVRENYRRELAVGSVRVNPFRLRLEMTGVSLPDADGAPMLGFSRLLVDAELASLWRRKLVLRTIELDAPQLRAVRRADGRFNLQDLVLASTSEAPPAQASPLQRLWIHTLAVTAGEAEFVDETQGGKAVPLRLAPLSLTTSALGIDLSQPQALQLETRLNERTKLSVDGKLSPSPLAASLQLGIEDLPLELLQPYALPGAALTIRSGTLTTKGQLVIASAGDAAPTVTFEGNVQMDALHTVDNLLQEDLLNFQRLSLEKLRYSSAPATLGIERVIVQEPYARLVISPKKVLNLSAVLQPVPAPPPSLKAPMPAAPAAQDDGEAMVVQIGEVQVHGARLSFADLNIQPNFAAEISALTGSVAPVSSARDARATIKLAGKVGEFSPVSIEGTLQPFAFDRHTRIRMSFSNIALPVFNPYSGVFAGFNIAKGKLDTQLSYDITDRRLKAGHHVRIDQLEWGEASQYKGEATLPVKFATALLRDRHGVIDLNLPVSGSLDDPKFRIGPLVWQILRNILVKAATAPFALLGSLFAGAEEAQYANFAPGSAQLDAATAEQLAALAKGLAERDGLAVDIPLGAIDDLDRPALLEQRIRAQLAARAPADEAAAIALAEQLRTTIVVTDADLEQLAQARGDAVQRALLAAGELPPARVFIVRDGKVSAHEGKVQLQLVLK
jgi:hypothetical protein